MTMEIPRHKLEELEVRRTDYINQLRQHNLVNIAAICEVLKNCLDTFRRNKSYEHLGIETKEGNILQGKELFETSFTLADIWKYLELEEQFSDVRTLEIRRGTEMMFEAQKKFSRREMRKTDLYSNVLSVYQNIRAIVSNKKIPKNELYDCIEVQREFQFLFLALTGEWGDSYNTVYFKLPLLEIISDKYFAEFSGKDLSKEQRTRIFSDSMREQCDPLSDDLLDILYSKSSDRNSGAPKEATEIYLARLLTSVGLIQKRGPKKKRKRRG